tara:strand:- start:88 stop:873 length:786 start_codon:yes stop_codon:yes gene_type:complete
MEERKTILWWRLLSSIAVINILLWVLTVAPLPKYVPYMKWHILLSGIYTAVCAFRSFVPRIDLERYCLIDSMVSSMVVGRSAATVAEISFAVQIGLLLHEVGALSGLLWVQAMTIPVIALLTIAQGFCWCGVMTLNNIYHAIEESIWALTFTLVGVGLGLSAPHMEGVWQTMGYTASILCAAYVLFMVVVDVPMYLKRWKAGKDKGEKLLGFRLGFADAWSRRIVTRDWKIWKPEVAWLTGYFSGAVWVSLAIAHLPRVIG